MGNKPQNNLINRTPIGPLRINSRSTGKGKALVIKVGKVEAGKATRHPLLLRDMVPTALLALLVAVGIILRLPLPMVFLRWNLGLRYVIALSTKRN